MRNKNKNYDGGLLIFCTYTKFVFKTALPAYALKEQTIYSLKVKLYFCFSSIKKITLNWFQILLEFLTICCYSYKLDKF